MKTTTLKTPLVHPYDDLLQVIANSIEKIPEKSVLAVTSKIVALSEGRVVAKTSDDKSEKHELVKKEAQYYSDPSLSKYDVILTIRDNILAVNAGVDESNVKDAYVLLPKNPFASARKIWQFLRDHYQVKEVGVVITDSISMPLKWGVVGRALAHCGFKALKNRIGDKDLFGRELKMTQMNIAEGVAATAVLEMGEGAESTPLCLIEEIGQIEFQERPPTEQELKDLRIQLEDDVYQPLLSAIDWQSK